MASPLNTRGAPSLTTSGAFTDIDAYADADDYSSAAGTPLNTASVGRDVGGGGYSPLDVDLYLVRHGESVANLKNIKVSKRAK